LRNSETVLGELVGITGGRGWRTLWWWSRRGDFWETGLEKIRRIAARFVRTASFSSPVVSALPCTCVKVWQESSKFGQFYPNPLISIYWEFWEVVALSQPGMYGWWKMVVCGSLCICWHHGRDTCVVNHNNSTLQVTHQAVKLISTDWLWYTMGHTKGSERKRSEPCPVRLASLGADCYTY